MVYCEQDMCESKLGRLMQAFRTDRPSEWQMDEFIRMAEDMHKMNKGLLEALDGVLAIVGDSGGVAGYHLNGDIADWGEFDEINAVYAVIAKAKAAS